MSPGRGFGRARYFSHRAGFQGGRGFNFRARGRGGRFSFPAEDNLEIPPSEFHGRRPFGFRGKLNFVPLTIIQRRHLFALFL